MEGEGAANGKGYGDLWRCVTGTAPWTSLCRSGTPPIESCLSPPPLTEPLCGDFDRRPLTTACKNGGRYVGVADPRRAVRGGSGTHRP